MNLNELSGITSAVNWHQEINKSLSLTNPMMEVVKAQQKIWDKLMPHKNIFNSYKLSATMTDAVFGLCDPTGMIADVKGHSNFGY
jgi:hypothetical protein